MKRLLWKVLQTGFCKELISEELTKFASERSVERVNLVPFQPEL